MSFGLAFLTAVVRRSWDVIVWVDFSQPTVDVERSDEFGDLLLSNGDRNRDHAVPEQCFVYELHTTQGPADGQYDLPDPFIRGSHTAGTIGVSPEGGLLLDNVLTDEGSGTLTGYSKPSGRTPDRVFAHRGRGPRRYPAPTVLNQTQPSRIENFSLAGWDCHLLLVPCDMFLRRALPSRASSNPTPTRRPSVAVDPKLPDVDDPLLSPVNPCGIRSRLGGSVHQTVAGEPALRRDLGRQRCPPVFPPASHVLVPPVVADLTALSIHGLRLRQPERRGRGWFSKVEG